MTMIKSMICLLAFAAGPIAAAFSADSFSLRVMTFNIRYDNPNDAPNHWDNRRDWVGELIRFYNADFVGMQEVLHNQLQDMMKRLPKYDHLGVGRDDGRRGGEYSAILYRSDKFELLDSSTFWLSESPEKPGSKSWDAAFPRVVTWGVFREKASGKRFFVFNTHFDHQGVVAREESARLLLKKINDIAGQTPAIITGDFNADTGSEAYRILTRGEDGLTDAYHAAAAPYGPEWTYTAFGKLPLKERKRIDYIFINQPMKVEEYVIISEQRGAVFPSDHLPVMAEIVF